METSFSLEERLALQREIEKEIDIRLEKVDICVAKCIDTISDTFGYLEDKGFLTPNMAKMFNEYMSVMERTKNILKQREVRTLSYSAETDLGKKVFELSEGKINPRWHGESITSADLSLTCGDKVVLVQDKATASDAYSIERTDLINILSDSITYRWYPILATSFRGQSGFQHFIVPIEEILSLIKTKQSASISRARLEGQKINYLSLEQFIERFMDCTFPVMKFDEKQFVTWLKRLEEEQS